MSLAATFHHTGILTEDLDAVRRVFAEVLGAQVDEPRAETKLGAEFMWVHIDGVALEFIAPTSPESRAAELIRERGAGVHHIALAVKDVDAALQVVHEAGIETIDTTPRLGVDGARIAFIAPAQVAGTLIELVQPARPNRQIDPEVR